MENLLSYFFIKYISLVKVLHDIFVDPEDGEPSIDAQCDRVGHDIDNGPLAVSVKGKKNFCCYLLVLDLYLHIYWKEQYMVGCINMNMKQNMCKIQFILF